MTGSSSRHPWLLILTVLQNTPGRQRGRARERPLSAHGFAVKSPSALRVEADGTASRGPAGTGVVGRPEALRCRRQWPGGGREVACGAPRPRAPRRRCPSGRQLSEPCADSQAHCVATGGASEGDASAVSLAASPAQLCLRAASGKPRCPAGGRAPISQVLNVTFGARIEPGRFALPRGAATAGPRSRVCLGSLSLLLVVISSPAPSLRSVNRCDLTVRYLFLRFKRLSMLKTPYFTGDTGGCQ